MTGFRRAPFNKGGRSFRQPPPTDAHRINHRITAREVRVIGPEGEQLGVLRLGDALAAAEQAGLDLVEVAGTAVPPVCRIMDYGKFKYKEQKKEAEARKKQVNQELKELRIRYRTDTGDLEIKMRQAREFLAEGNKVKFSMKFRGREQMYLKLGTEKFNEIIEALKDVAMVDERSPERGSNLHIVLAPLKPGQKPKTAAAPEKPAPSAPSAVTTTTTSGLQVTRLPSSQNSGSSK